MQKHKTILSMVQIAMFAAVLAVLSQISIPLPSGVPITLQTFAVALTAYALGWKRGMLSVGIYLALGAVGIPVFAGFTGGVAKFVSVTGGYLWGFLPMALLCGLAIGIWQQQWRGRIGAIFFSIAGLCARHIPGVLQFALVSGSTPLHAFLLASAPYLVKDVISLILAFALAIAIRRALQRQQGVARETE